MFKQNMAFQVGDQVIHWVYGLGEVVQLDEKELFGQTNQYYVVQTSDLTLWVPVDESSEGRLRFPTPAKDFHKIFDILASPGEALSADRYERKTQLTERLKDGTLESVCRVVRDLTCHKRIKKMNDHDSAVLERARCFLVNEWSVALSVPAEQAERELAELLGEEQHQAKSL
jgi:CarD family transcriptional regulator